MGIDDFSFSNKNLEVKKFNDPPAEICDCGLAWSTHTIRGGRRCRQDGNT